MQIAQIHESETDVRWQYPEEIKECHNCHKALKSGKDKVGSRNSKLVKNNIVPLLKKS